MICANIFTFFLSILLAGFVHCAMEDCLDLAIRTEGAAGSDAPTIDKYPASCNSCPLSFRTVDSIDYKKAMLIFYEQNNLHAFKKIFIDQYEFAVREYF